MFRPILPGKFDSGVFRDEVQDATQPALNGIQKSFEASYRTWSMSSQPTQDVRKPFSGNIIFAVYIIGQIYRFVHEGTRPHRITVRRARRLVFQSGYRAKTQPGRIQAKSGGPFGRTVYAMSVNHPGFKGRKQSELIADKWQPLFTLLAQQGLDNGAKKSGHGI